MLSLTTHDDVTALELSWWRSRAAGLSVFAYVVRGVLIDTGFPASWGALARYLETTRIRGVLVTHYHEDHAGNVSRLVALGARVAISDATLALIRNPDRIGLYRHITWTAMRAFSAPIVPFVDTSFELIATPGHSPDHHAVWDHETSTLFAGDLFLGVKVRIAHLHEQPRAHVAALRAMVSRAPSRVFCGHRGLLPNGMALLAAKADWMEATIEHIESRAREGRSISAIRKELFGARGLTDLFSAGDYSAENLIRAVLRESASVLPSAPRAHQ